MGDKKFVDGLRVYKPRDNAPEFVKANFVINKAELEAWLRNQGDEIRIDLKESREGKLYCDVNEWKKEAPRSEAPAFTGEDLGLGYGGESPF